MNDVAGCLNAELHARRSLSAAATPVVVDYGVAVNCAVEESLLAARVRGALLPQDAIVREHITPRDVLIVSVGGNDVALVPTYCTIASMVALTWGATDAALEAGTAWGMRHIIRLFKDDVTAYILSLCGDVKPALVLVCMIYYPHEQPGGWPDAVLGLLRYTNPAGIRRLQTVIRKLFELATAAINIPGVRVVPIPLFSVLDPRPASQDYVARVEPSVEGGRKMAVAFANAIIGAAPAAATS